MKKTREHVLYKKWRPRAESVKIGSQMVIGGGIFIILLIKLILHTFYSSPRGTLKVFVDHHPLEIVGYALALSAGVELAYMLFTEGPDEALDPLILGLASAVLLVVSQNSVVSWEIALTILSFSLSIGFLFFMRDKYRPGEEGNEVTGEDKMEREDKSLEP